VEYFRSASERAVGLVRSGIKQRLVEASNHGASQAGGDPEVSAAMGRAIDELIGLMDVHPVAAPDFRDLLSGDPESLTTLRCIEDTNIPRLSASLHGFAERFCESNRQQLASAAQSFHKHVVSELRVHLERWTSDVRADEAAKEMKEKLRVFLEPLSADFHRRQGQMKEFLDSTMPREIGASRHISGATLSPPIGARSRPQFIAADDTGGAVPTSICLANLQSDSRSQLPNCGAGAFWSRFGRTFANTRTGAQASLSRSPNGRSPRAPT
jgi:hypothetical protein